MIKKNFDDVTEFHGHVCPGSAFGYKAATVAMEKLNIISSKDEEIVAIVENNSCAIDGIQVVLGTTFGKGNLFFKDHGKQVYTIINRNNGKSIRLSMKKSFNIEKVDPEINHLRKKARNHDLCNSEKELINKKVANLCNNIINLNPEEIFNIDEIKVEIPDKVTIYDVIECDECGELATENRIRNSNDKRLCIPCFEKKINSY